MDPIFRQEEHPEFEKNSLKSDLAAVPVVSEILLVCMECGRENRQTVAIKLLKPEIPCIRMQCHCGRILNAPLTPSQNS